MSRSKRFVASLVSSYAAIGVNILYTIASIPLALRYLDKQEFGLWALVMQLSGYLILLEFGMTGSVARSLSDHKDHIEDGNYGNVLRTGARVFAIQGFLVAILGLAVAWFGPSLLGIPERLQHTFTVLMAAQAIINGTKLGLGTLASPLWCHQRLDLSNLASSISLVITFAVLWLGFHLGWKLYSLTVAAAVGSVCGLLFTYVSCRRLGYYPTRAHRGHFDSRLFRELFHFGSGLFMMNLGAQLASASQVILCSRMLGMEAAAVWSISTKIFSLAQQFVGRVLDSSAGGLAEMAVRKESATLQKRFHDIVSISAVMAVIASAGIALTNGPFIEIWTSGRISWNPWNNLLLAMVLFSTAVTRSHTSLVGITKEIRGMKFVYLLEGLMFVTLSIILVPRIGITGLLIAALACNIGITGTYGIRRTADYFGIATHTVFAWCARPVGVLLLVVILFAITRVSGLAGLDSTLRFVIGASLCAIIVIPSIWFFGMNPSLRREFSSLFDKIRLKAQAALHMI